MNAAELVQALTHTLNPVKAQREAAEEYLKKGILLPGFVQGLLQVASTNELPHIRLAASVQLKNSIRKHWAVVKDDQQQNSNSVQKVQISEQDKNVIRENIFEATVGSPVKAVRATLGEAINQIANSDFCNPLHPQTWPSLMGQILGGFQGNDMLRVTNTLEVSRRLFKNFEFRDRDRRQPNETLVNALFPAMEQILSQVLQGALGSEPAQVDAAGNIARLVSKCVWSGAMFIVPQYFKVRDNVLRWVTMLNEIVRRDVQALLPEDDEDRADYSWIKAKKWCVRYFHRLFSRFGNFKFVAEEDKDFCGIFVNDLSTTLLQTILEVVSLRMNGKYCSDRMMMYGINYLGCAAEIGVTWVHLKPHLETVLLKICFPVLYFNDQDYELWTEEPHEYIRKTYDPMEEYTDPRSAVVSFLLDLAKLRYKSTIPGVLAFCTQVLNRYDQTQDMAQKPVREKEGVMGILGSLHDSLSKKKATKGQIEPLLIQHIMPEFQSPHGFMRARACWVMQQFAGDIEWQNKMMQLQAAQNVVNCLKDPDFPVQITAATALQYLIRDAEDVTEDAEEGAPDHPVIQVVKSVLPQILQAYFAMMNEIGVDEVIDALSTIISALADDIEPYAVDIVSNLCGAFQRYASQGMSQDDDEAAMAASNCIESINVLLSSLPDDKPELFRTMEQYVLPIVAAIINPQGQGMEYLENVLDTVSYLTWGGPEPFSQELWAIFPQMYLCFDKFAWDFIQDMISPVDNYINQDNNTFCTGGANVEGAAMPYTEMVLRMVQKIFENNQAHASDVVGASRMYLTMLHNCHGKIDHVVPMILQGTLNRMRQPMEGAVSLAMLEIIESSFIYNASATLQFLVSQDALQFVFTLLMAQLQNHESTRQKKICILGLLSIIQLNPAELPDLIKQGYAQVLTKTVEMLHNLVRQKEEEGDSDDSSEESSSSEESDSDESDGDDAEDDDEEDNDADDMADATTQDDEDYMKMLEEMQKEAAANPDVWDQQEIEDGEDKYTSRLDEVSALASFVATFQHLPADVIQSLHPQVQNACQTLVQKAQEEAVKKQQKEAEKAAQGPE
jgi:importin-7